MTSIRVKNTKMISYKYDVIAEETLRWRSLKAGHLKGITHGEFFVYIKLGIISLCTEP